MSELLAKARNYEKNITSKIPDSQRPVFHFSNPAGWMNDPNGFSDYRGEHHLFFQYYPYATHWDSMHWGHAKSKDFIQWEYLPAALAPDKDYDGLGAFSGSALEDGERQILVYTGVEEQIIENGEKRVAQNQCIAIGNGINYEKFSNNPVITSDMLPDGSSREDFRDPKVWKEDNQYYLVAGSRNADGSGQIALFYSKDLKNWKFGSILDKSENKIGKMWECPDFFALNEKHILMISPQDMHADGLEFHNGNNTAFLIGEYDKENMQFHRTCVQTVDYGLDFYAPQTMLTEDGRRIIIAWMQSWDNHMCPADYLWSGMMTIPRELFIKNGRIYQNPVRELENYRENPVVYSNLCVEKETALKGIEGRSIDLILSIKEGDYQNCKIKVASDGQFYSEIVYDKEKGMLTFDRTYSGNSRDTISTRSMFVNSENGILKLRILIDRYSVEIFVNDGKQAMTSLIYTSQSASSILFESSGRTYMDVEKYELSVRK